MTSRILSPEDRDYPAELRRLASEPATGETPCPPLLYMRGALSLGAGVAIVGSRKPPEGALRFTHELARTLAESGLALWSGGAVGIDREVHVAALDVGAPTVAVLPCGLERLYPSAHTDLFAAIVARGGALVSLWPDDVHALPVRFLQRNRVLAALTCATIVASAQVRSGARACAAAARRLGRPVGAVPDAPFGSHPGTAEELALGAFPVTQADHVLRVVGDPTLVAGAALDPRPRARRAARTDAVTGTGHRSDDKSYMASPGASAASRHAPRQRAERSTSSALPTQQLLSFSHLGALERDVVTRLAERACHLDELCAATGQPFTAVSEAVLTLTLAAIVVEGPAGFFRAVQPPDGVDSRGAHRSTRSPQRTSWEPAPGRRSSAK